MKCWTIYCHTHTESGHRYVGLTSKTMLARWNDHVYKARSSKGGRWHFPNAIRKYGKDAFSHEVLETHADLDQANLAEEWFIRKFDSRNLLKGFNLAKGGAHAPHPIRKNPWDCPEYRTKAVPKLIARTHTPEALEKMRKNNRTQKFRDEASKRSREALKDPKVREKIVKAGVSRRGKPLSPEHKERIGEKSKGRRPNEETRKKISNAGLGRKLSEETKAKIKASRSVKAKETAQKISDALKGRKFSEEHRANLAAAQIGKKHSIETIEKLRAVASRAKLKA